MNSKGRCLRRLGQQKQNWRHTIWGNTSYTQCRTREVCTTNQKDVDWQRSLRDCGMDGRLLLWIEAKPQWGCWTVKNHTGAKCDTVLTAALWPSNKDKAASDRGWIYVLIGSSQPIFWQQTSWLFCCTLFGGGCCKTVVAKSFFMGTLQLSSFA